MVYNEEKGLKMNARELKLRGYSTKNPIHVYWLTEEDGDCYRGFRSMKQVNIWIEKLKTCGVPKELIDII